MSNKEIDKLIRDFGVSYSDILILSKQGRKLRSIYEKECNGEIYYCEDREHYVRCSPWSGEVIGKYPDYVTPCKKRIKEVLGRYPHLSCYLQGDPRGGTLYLYRKADLKEGEHIQCVYSNIGLWVPDTL